MNLGQIIFDRRIELKMTRTKLAYEAGCSVQWLSCIETGKAFPGIPLWRQFAEKLQLQGISEEVEKYLTERQYE